jgi:hypothetical protein
MAIPVYSDIQSAQRDSLAEQLSILLSVHPASSNEECANNIIKLFFKIETFFKHGKSRSSSRSLFLRKM